MTITISIVTEEHSQVVSLSLTILDPNGNQSPITIGKTIGKRDRVKQDLTILLNDFRDPEANETFENVNCLGEGFFNAIFRRNGATGNELNELGTVFVTTLFEPGGLLNRDRFNGSWLGGQDALVVMDVCPEFLRFPWELMTIRLGHDDCHRLCLNPKIYEGVTFELAKHLSVVRIRPKPESSPDSLRLSSEARSSIQLLGLFANPDTWATVEPGSFCLGKDIGVDIMWQRAVGDLDIASLRSALFPRRLLGLLAPVTSTFHGLAYLGRFVPHCADDGQPWGFMCEKMSSETEPLTACEARRNDEIFGGLLKESNEMEIAYLGAGFTARIKDGSPSLIDDVPALWLLDRGIRYVIAMQHEMDGLLAKLFLAEVCRSLGAGNTVPAAMLAARRALIEKPLTVACDARSFKYSLLTKPKPELAWWIPVLYTFEAGKHAPFVRQPHSPIPVEDPTSYRTDIRSPSMRA